MSEGEQRATKRGTTRRAWLRLAAGGTALAGVSGGGYALWRWRRFSTLEPHARKLAWFLAGKVDRLGLDFDDGLIESWIGEHLRLHGPLERAPKGASRKLVQSLMLSTDLFTEGGGEVATRFVSYYDPHLNPCYNPLREA